MINVTQKEINYAVNNCHWRDLGGLDVCRLLCLPCAVVIDLRQCDTLMELFHGAEGETKK